MTLPDARVALVTGGARGIGRGIADDLARDGWRVAICYLQSRDDAEAFLESSRRVGAEGMAVVCDVAVPEQALDLVSDVVARWGRIDALINGVGPLRRIALLDETPSGWRGMFATNLDSVFFVTQAVAPIMIRQRGGRIISFGLANMDHLAAQPQITAHAIAKLGVLALTRSYARVLGPHGITVNAVSPGFIDSGSADLDEFSSMTKRIPAGYVGAVDDAVGVVRFLLSADASYVNGANIQVSGGWGL